MKNMQKIPLKITAVYAICSGVWILLTDKVAFLLAPDTTSLASWSTRKGLFFILVTSVFIYWIVSHYLKVLVRSKKTIDQQERGLFASRISLRNLRGRMTDSEMRLVASERKYRALFENADDAVLLFSGSAIVDCNPMAEKIFAFSREDLLRKGSGDLSPKLQPNGFNSRAKLEEMLADTLSGRAQRFEWILQKADGSLFDGEINMSRVEIDGTVLVQAFIRDATERKQLEAQLRHSQKMEAVGSLAGGVAHEFNNILTAIIGYASLVEMRMDREDPSIQNLEQIHSAVDRATLLTKGLLSYGRIQKISPHPVDLNGITQSVAKLLTPIIGEDIEVRTSTSREKLMTNADGSLIDNVLMNLVTNARDAMPDGGVLTISTEKAELGDDFFNIHGYGETSNYALLTVSDSGTGMDEPTRLRIFEPFFTTKEVGKGTGLGLSVAYGIVKQHKGFINVLSSQDKGTTVQVYMPLISEDTESLKHASLALARGKETVLVAEDDAGVRKLIRKVLTEFGYTVFEAADGEDAARVFAENSDTVELVIFDLILPKKSARDACLEMKMINPDLKVLFTSGYTADVIHKKGVLEDGLPYLAKPIVPTELLARVREIMEQ